jgi:hypothetical protein
MQEVDHEQHRCQLQGDADELVGQVEVGVRVDRCVERGRLAAQRLVALNRDDNVVDEIERCVEGGGTQAQGEDDNDLEPKVATRDRRGCG